MQSFLSKRSAGCWLAFSLAGLACVGCQSSQQPSLFGNSFFAPSRVPPPTTRALVPGTAQPYYPGDPVPVLQGATDQPNSPLVTAANAPPVLESNPPSLATPGTPARTASVPPIQRVTLHESSPPARFPVQQASAVVADTGFTQPAVPAAATAPLDRPGVIGPDGRSNSAASGSPIAWRDPGVAHPPGSPGGAPRPLQVAPIPPAQSVPSYPSAQYAASVQNTYPFPQNGAPRIRLPGYSQLGQPTAGLAGTIPPGFTLPAGGGVPQTVRITELPSRAAQQAALAAQDAASWQTPIGASSTASHADGFRARSNLR